MKLIFLGPQGSGKSTQAKIVAQMINIPQIEMGQILRDKAKESSKEGNLIAQSLSKGELVPNEITIKVLKERLSENDCQRGYTLDGYPRNAQQYAALDEDIDKVFYVYVNDDESIKRLAKRLRHDDTPQLLARRLEIYHEQTEPLLRAFRTKGILEEVDGERTIEEISKDIEERLKSVQK